MKVYIAGRITGDPDYREKFAAFADIERQRGNAVLNPAVLPLGLTQADYMRICFAMIDSADQVCFIPDYKESAGARLEMAYCDKINKPYAVYAVERGGRHEKA